MLCYTLKDSKSVPVTNVLGKYDGTGGDKRFHYWGQEENPARYYIDVFSHEGDLIVDYFVGGGTTAVVCKKLNRNFIGFENNTDTFKIATYRLNDILPPAKFSQEIMELNL